MIIITSTPPEAVEPVVDGPTREVAPLAYQWESWTGDVWNLTDPGGKLVKVRGATGYGFAPVTHWYDTAPGIAGAIHTGSHDDMGSLFLPLEVYGTDSADFLVNHRAFIRSLDPSQRGVHRVTTPDGITRYTFCRYSDGLDSPVELDPVASCRVRYGVTWDRDDPYWLGDTVTATYVADTAPDFFSASGSVATISVGNVLDSAAVTNPGDVAAHAKWTITGPVDTFEVGVGSAVLAMDVTLLAGESITADMDPRVLQILDGTGTDRLGDATDVTFATIPAGEDIPLTIAATGTGTGFGVTLEFVARYRTAF